jgi:hypothetical protein
MCTLTEKWHTTGSVLDKAHYGKKIVLMDEKLEDIWTWLQISPWKSLRHLSQETGVAVGSASKAPTRRYQKVPGNSSVDKKVHYILVTGDDPGRKGWIIHGMLTEILAHCNAIFFLLRVQQSGDKFGSDTLHVQF